VPLIEQVAELLGAELLLANAPDEAMPFSVDLLLWHTTMNFDEQIYNQLIARYPRMVVLCPRPERVWIGSGEYIKVPYIIVPIDPEDACTVIRGTFGWPRSE